MRLAAIVFVLVTLSGCGTTRVGMTYAPTAAVTPIPSTASPLMLGAFQDQRGEASNWIGVIRGGFGNHLKEIETQVPVADLVKSVFSDGLAARGVKRDASAPLTLTGNIKKLYCDKVIHTEATVEIEITVTDRKGQPVFSHLYEANNKEGSMFTLSTGVFADPDELRVLMEKTLRETVDKALDDTALRAALQI